MLRPSFLIGLVCAVSVVSAQEKPYKQEQTDENYIVDYANSFMVRLYGSNKFTRLSYGRYGSKEKVIYKPNSNFNIGAGFSYKWLDINIGIKAPGINNDNDRYGKTKYLDLQGYLYLRKFTVDFYGQSYEGYYLANSDILANSFGNNLIRSDLQTRNAGVNLEYIFNHRKFSYRAAFIQNEYQKKSAGSFLVGAGFHYINVRADSSIIPVVKYADFLDGERFNRSSVGSLAVSAGYAHTFVINEHFFIMGAAMAGGGVNNMTLKDEAAKTQNTKISMNVNGVLRAGIGYNSHSYYAGIYFVTNLIKNRMPVTDNWQLYETGVLRLAVAKRFSGKPKPARVFDRIEDKIIGE